MRHKKTARSAARSKPRDAGSGVLIAVELGATWPDLAPEDQNATRRVVSQREGETPADFAERVGSVLDGLFGRGVALGSTILACNERADGAAQDARRKLAGLALGSMAKSQAGRVYFAAPPRSSGRVRAALSCLAQGLHDEWRTAGLEVTVDFGERVATAPAPVFTFTARVA